MVPKCSISVATKPTFIGADITSFLLEEGFRFDSQGCCSSGEYVCSRLIGRCDGDKVIVAITDEVVAIVNKVGCFCIHINYIKDRTELKPLSRDKVAGLDLGLNNVCSLVSNTTLPPTLLNGRHIKSINQFYNKKVADLRPKLPIGQHTSHRIDAITRKRNNKIKSELHLITNFHSKKTG